MLCSYGCEKESNFILKNGKHCCSKRPAGCEILKKINSKGVKLSYKTGRKNGGYKNYQKLPQETKDKMAWSRGKNIIPNEIIFTTNSLYSAEYIKERIIKNTLIKYECNKCRLTNTWMNESIILDLDHINGKNTDNRLENLRFLCPNCHSQTATYKRRNKNTGIKKVSDKDLLTAYNTHASIRKALLSVGLAAKGGN